MRWAGNVTRMGKTGVYRVLVEKPEGKRPLGRPRFRGEILEEIESSGNGMWGYGLDRAGSG